MYYNQQGYVADTLEAPLTQDLDVQYEIVLSDNCSSDNTTKIIEEFAKEAPHIRVLHHTANVGIHHNWQQAIDACTGELIAPCTKETMC